VYEVGETEDGQVFLATEYVKGWTLRSWYDEEHRSEATIVDIMRQVALGVQAAHDEGLVHRDLKPANILVGHDGRVRVADFGLARFDPTALEPGGDVPRDGVATTTAGTPGYMAPELFEGSPASAASDQYALAVTLRELVHGRLASETAKRPNLRGPVATALQRGLADRPEDRFVSVKAFADALSARAAGHSRRRMLGLGAALVGLGCVSAALLLLPAGQSSKPDAEVALLKAQAALPNDPAGALDALRDVADLDDDRALAIAERALLLGPEDARWSLPEGTRTADLFGDLLVYRDAQDDLVARRLSRTEAPRVELESVGLVGLQVGPMHIVGTPRVKVDDPVALLSADAIAARSLDRRWGEFGMSKDGTRVVRVELDRQRIVVEDLRTHDVLWTLSKPDHRFSSVSIDDSGLQIAWAESEGAAFVHDLETDATYPIDPLAAEVWFESGGGSVIVRGKYSGVFQVRLSDGLVTRLFEEDARFLQVELSPDGTWIAARKEGGEIHVGWMQAWTPQTFEGDGFVFSPDGSRLATHGEGQVVIHDLWSGDSQTFVAPNGVERVQFVTDDVFWVVGADRVVRRYTVDLGQALIGHTAPVYDIDLSNDGEIAVSSAHDYTVRLWDVASGDGRVLANIDWESHYVALNEVRDEVAVVRVRGETSVFDLDGQHVVELPHSWGRPRVSPDGDWIGAGSQGVWRHRDGETTYLLNETCRTLLVEGNTIAATCGEDPTALHVWSDGEHRQAPLQPGGYERSLHAWPSAEQIALLGSTSTVFALGEGDRLEASPAPRSLIGTEDYFFPTASSAAHDLLLGRRDGLFVAWDVASEPIRLSADSSTVLAISGDGDRYAFATPRHRIIVRDRPVSKARRDLASVLEAHTVVEGEL
jgi:serine/threonine protein kinase